LLSDTFDFLLCLFLECEGHRQYLTLSRPYRIIQLYIFQYIRLVQESRS
jgi:hypothetical protein